MENKYLNACKNIITQCIINTRINNNNKCSSRSYGLYSLYSWHFFQSKYASQIHNKPEKSKKRKSVHPIVSGKAIKDYKIILELEKYKQNTVSVNKLTTMSINKGKKSINAADQLGPSKYNETYSNSDTTDDESDSSKCCVQ